MTKKIGIFVDTSDLYHKIRRKFGGGKLDYQVYYDTAAEWGSIEYAFAYGMQSEREAGGFIACLKAAGFYVYFKRPRIIRCEDREIKRCEWGVGIAMEIVSLIKELDIVVLGSSNSDLIPLIKWAKNQDVGVFILASGIPESMKGAADSAIEITEDYLEENAEIV